MENFIFCTAIALMVSKASKNFSKTVDVVLSIYKVISYSVEYCRKIQSKHCGWMISHLSTLAFAVDYFPLYILLFTLKSDSHLLKNSFYLLR